MSSPGNAQAADNEGTLCGQNLDRRNDSSHHGEDKLLTLFPTGALVEVHGLTKAQHLNCERGIVNGKVQQGRLGIDFWPPGGSKALRPENLKLVEEGILPQASPRGLHLVAMLAVHVVDDARLKRLRCCFASIAAQSQAPAAVFMSWSAATSALCDEVQRFIENFHLPCSMTVRHSKDRSSQFQHYRTLAAEICKLSGDPIWAIFSDDDDLWHPRRIEHFAEAAVVATRSSQIAVGVFRDARPVAPSADIGSWKDVDAMLQQGRARLWGDVQQTRDGFRLEYFHYCVRGDALLKFFEQAADPILGSSYCDLAFAEYIRAECKRVGPPTLCEPGESEWMYYYNRVPGSKARNSAGAFAQHDYDCLAHLPADIAHMKIPPQIGELAFLAKLRTNVEMLLLEEYPTYRAQRVHQILLPMLLDRMRPQASATPFLQPQSSEQWAAFEVRHDAKVLKAARCLVDFYIQRLAEVFGLRATVID